MNFSEIHMKKKLMKKMNNNSISKVILKNVKKIKESDVNRC